MTPDCLDPIIAQLRHAYAHLKAGRVTNPQQFADGLIAPQIQALEGLRALLTGTHR
jgi:hypothetical protein